MSVSTGCKIKNDLLINKSLFKEKSLFFYKTGGSEMRSFPSEHTTYQ